MHFEHSVYCRQKTAAAAPKSRVRVVPICTVEAPLVVVDDDGDAAELPVLEALAVDGLPAVELAEFEAVRVAMVTKT